MKARMENFDECLSVASAKVGLCGSLATTAQPYIDILSSPQYAERYQQLLEGDHGVL
jgi:hypothetical protein